MKPVHSYTIVTVAVRILSSIIVLSLLMMTDSSAQSQIPDSCNFHVEGYVLDLETQQAIPYANVQLKGSTRGVITDEKGYFRVNKICEKGFDLIISYVGYKTITHHHDIYHEVPQIMLAPENFKLKSVVVEGISIPGEMYSGTISKLSTAEFEQNQSLSLGDLANRISGVNTLSTGQNIVKPVIHGLHSNRVLIVNNGVRHEFQNWGVEHAPEIDPSMAENISVLKGAATVRYGPDALGGVLLIEPAPLELISQLHGEVDLVTQSNGGVADGHVQLQKGFKRIAVQGQLSYAYQGDLRSPDYQLSNTGRRELSTSLSARYHWKFLDLFAYYSHFEQELGILRGSVTGNLNDLAEAIESSTPALTTDFEYQIDNPRQLVNHDLFKLKGLVGTENQSLEATYAVQMNHRFEFDVRRGTNNERPAINLQLTTHSLDVDWKHPDLGKWNGKIGIQGLYQDNNNLPGTNTVPFIPNYNNTRLGFYLIEAAKLEDIRLEWGIRYDFQRTSIRGRKPNNDIYRNSLDFQNVTATLGILKPLNKNSLFRSNIGTAWRPPNVSELFSFGKHSASIEYGIWRYERQENGQIRADDVLDQNDKPVFSEMGLKWINTYEINKELFQTELTAYINFIQNYIYTTPAGITQTVRGAFPYFVYEQDDALFAGIDASMRSQLVNKLSNELKISFLWAKNLEQDDFFVGLPPANIFYGLNYQLPDIGKLKKQQVNADVSYTFTQFFAPRVIPIRNILDAKEQDTNIFDGNTADFDILPPPDGYFLLNMGWNAEVRNFQIGFQVKNLLNVRYRNYTNRLRYFADELGRNFVLSVKYQI